jgi:hypothetical protein
MSTSYATAAELKRRINVASSDTTDDTDLETIIERVSRAIDDYCRRRFHKDSAATTRYYTAERMDRITVDDLVSVTTLYTDADGDRTYEDTWTATDFDLWPWNAAADNQPYERIEVTPDGDYRFPPGVAKGVKVTAVFGWPDVPGPVEEACLAQSSRVWAKRNAPLGVVGASEFGPVNVRLDPEIRDMLNPYRRLEF